jgi:hypothetical protein
MNITGNIFGCMGIIMAVCYLRVLQTKGAMIHPCRQKFHALQIFCCFVSQLFAYSICMWTYFIKQQKLIVMMRIFRWLMIGTSSNYLLTLKVLEFSFSKHREHRLCTQPYWICLVPMYLVKHLRWCLLSV